MGGTWLAPGWHHGLAPCAGIPAGRGKKGAVKCSGIPKGWGVNSPGFPEGCGPRAMLGAFSLCSGLVHGARGSPALLSLGR